MSKFKNTEELEKAYKELEREFTKKIQKLAEAQKTIEIQNKVNDALIDENLDYRYGITDTAYERAKEMAENWEEDYQQELHELKDKLQLTEKALELACEILRDFTGNCPYDQFNLDMPNDCDEQCEEQMKRYFCWDKYLVNRAKEMMKSELRI